MKTIFLVFICFMALQGFPQPRSVKQVKAALDEQVNAWNAGQLEKAMGYYYNSPDLLWISRAGIAKGYEPIFQGYVKDYTDRSLMGTYSYEPLHIEVLSAAKVFYVFRWKIDLNGKKIMGGISSQIWKRSGKDWLIISEHAS